ncbi:MAG: ABC-2 family transporter protein [Spirochaetaceae bacterium]|nr:ABC-2 family transporter protein [Spirochaetaceae bacterium]
MNIFKLYLFYTKISLKSWFQYKIDACLRSFAVFLREGANIIVIYLTLKSFNDLNGWTTFELLFLYSFIFFTYSILIVFFTGLRDIERLVNTGNFDRFLLRPQGVLFQTLASNSDWFAAIGHGMLGLILIIFSAYKIGIKFTFFNIFYFIFSIISGVFIQGAIFLFIASISFFSIKVNNLRNILYYDIRQFAGYPIDMFPKILQILMIYIIPFAFVNFFPAQFFLNKFDVNNFHTAYIYIAPIIGFLLYFLAYMFWKFSLKHYKSTGN